MQHTTLDNLAAIRSGFPFRGRIVHDPKGHTRVLQIKDLRLSPKLSTEGQTLVDTPPGLADRRLQPGDIVIPARGDFRRAITFARPEPTIAGSQLLTLQVSSDAILPAYLCWALNQPAAQHAMENEARGTNMPLLTRQSLGALTIQLPSLATQQKIVEIQELWDQEQQLTQQLLTNRQAMLKGMVQTLMNHEEADKALPDGDKQ